MTVNGPLGELRAFSRWGVRSENGTVYGVGIWRDGVYHPGSWWRARRERRLLRRDGETGARVVRIKP